MLKCSSFKHMRLCWGTVLGHERYICVGHQSRSVMSHHGHMHSLHKEMAFLISAAWGSTFWAEKCCSEPHSREFLRSRKALAQVVTRDTMMTRCYRLWTVKIKGLSGWFQIHNWWEQDDEVQISAFHKGNESGFFSQGVHFNQWARLCVRSFST